MKSLDTLQGTKSFALPTKSLCQSTPHQSFLTGPFLYRLDKTRYYHFLKYLTIAANNTISIWIFFTKKVEYFRIYFIDHTYFILWSAYFCYLSICPCLNLLSSIECCKWCFPHYTYIKIVDFVPFSSFKLYKVKTINILTLFFYLSAFNVL